MTPASSSSTPGASGRRPPSGGNGAPRIAPAPYFTDAERAALALTEAVTRLSDRADPVPDEVWNEAVKRYDEQGLAALILMIATTNVFNRLNITTRQVAGAWG